MLELIVHHKKVKRCGEVSFMCNEVVLGQYSEPLGGICCCGMVSTTDGRELGKCRVVTEDRRDSAQKS